ncbi:hypothetical protein L1987_44452 [Smallanthus sonchifolius]|uniref:Uncharacterized protein n=1 Tax=Smallanthus sonchifolius TaxID=185202 RepID=A0ACB9GQP0_9ASTR|nr:hypothetical protein L1987_44452 [Smallanthus sonchifolius]
MSRSPDEEGNGVPDHLDTTHPDISSLLLPISSSSTWVSRLVHENHLQLVDVDTCASFAVAVTVKGVAVVGLFHQFGNQNQTQNCKLFTSKFYFHMRLCSESFNFVHDV